jgi:hypothetical protein
MFFLQVPGKATRGRTRGGAEGTRERTLEACLRVPRKLGFCSDKGAALIGVRAGLEEGGGHILEGSAAARNYGIFVPANGAVGELRITIAADDVAGGTLEDGRAAEFKANGAAEGLSDLFFRFLLGLQPVSQFLLLLLQLSLLLLFSRLCYFSLHLSFSHASSLTFAISRSSSLSFSLCKIRTSRILCKT